MVLGHITSLVARAGTRVAKRLSGVHDDHHLSFLSHAHFPELFTISRAPNELRSKNVRARYETSLHKLTINLHSFGEVTFVLRHDHIAVISPQPFQYKDFRAALKQELSYTKSQNRISSPALPIA